jgi:ferrous iron transport protein A
MDAPAPFLLSNVEPGNMVYVQGVENSDLKTKMMEMGIVKGQPLFVLFKAPFGDPIAIDVNGYVLSLRLDEAQLIRVEASQESTRNVNV